MAGDPDVSNIGPKSKKFQVKNHFVQKRFFKIKEMMRFTASSAWR